MLEIASLALSDGAVLEVGRTTSARHDVLEQFRELLAVVLLVTVLVGLAVGVVLTRRALQPVRDLARIVGETVRTGRLDARVPQRPGGDALDELVRLVNAMLDRIGSLVEGMHGSLDAVAHDLRTPLMRLRVVAERAIVPGADAAACHEALSDCLEEAERLGEMLDSLMDLSEAEAGAMALRRETVPVSSLFEDTRELFDDLAEARGVTLHSDDPGELAVDGDRNRLRQVLANLVDNALKHTPAGGEVVLAAQGDDGDVVLAVSDTGEGIADDDLPRIWDRLFRGDRSRSTRGLGLGLSLVRAIVEAHGGRATVESAPGRGSRFALHLSAAPRGPDLSHL